MKINFFSILLFGIIFFQLNGFYLIDGNPIQNQDVAIMLELLFFVLVYVNRDSIPKKRKNMIFLFPIVLVCASAVMAYLRYKQPIFMGLRPQRAWLVSMLMYFPLSRIIRQRRYSIDKMINVIDKVNFIYFVLLFIQYVFGNKYIFLHIMFNRRYGSIRLYASTSFMLISYSWHLWNSLLHRKLKFEDCFYVVSTLFTYFFITKARMGMIAILGATAIVVLRQRFSKKKLFLILVSIVGLCFFMNSNAGKETLQLIFGKTITTAANDTAMIREVGRTFYISEVMSSFKTFIFGCGYINTDWNPTVIATRINENIFVVDNGIFGLVFMYGMLFLCWTLTLYTKYLRDAFNNKNEFGVFLFLFGVLECYSLYPECYRPCIAFPLTCVIFEYICYRKKQGEILT